MNRVIKSKVFEGSYVFGEELGAGASATVYKVALKQEGRENRIFACKKISIKYLQDVAPKKAQQRWRAMVRELTLMEILNSEYIIQMHEFIRTANNFYMIQEFSNGGSLQGLLDIHERLPEAIAKKVLKQIIAGMKTMYDKKIIHRDLKLDNILINFPRFSDQVPLEQIKQIDLATEEFTIKIADLGYSRSLEADQRAMTGCGTPLLMAPETLLGRAYDFKVDVWALGVVFYIMITGIYVFNATSMDELINRIRRGQWSWPRNVKFSLQGLEFLKGTFQYNPDDRLNWAEVSRHPYLSMDTVSDIDLQILFSDSDPDSSAPQSGYEGQALVINTRDPRYFDRLYAKATNVFMNKCQPFIEDNEKQLLAGAGNQFADSLKQAEDIIIDQVGAAANTNKDADTFASLVEPDVFEAEKAAREQKARESLTSTTKSIALAEPTTQSCCTSNCLIF